MEITKIFHVYHIVQGTNLFPGISDSENVLKHKVKF